MRAVLVNDEASWVDLYSRLQTAECVCFDIETTCLDPLADIFQVVGLGFAFDTVTGYYVPINHQKPRQRVLIDPSTGKVPDPIVQLPEKWVVERLRPILETKPIMGHGLKFDYQGMKCAYGIRLNNIVYDTLAAAHIYDERGRHSLKLVTEKYLGYKQTDFMSVTGKGDSQDRKSRSNFETVPPLKAAAYAVQDVVNPARLRQYFRPHLSENSKFMNLLVDEVLLTPVTADMELVGARLDTQHLVTIHNDVSREAKVRRETVLRIAKNPHLNPGSQQQMVHLLYNQVGLKFPGRRASKISTKGMTDRKAIEKLVVNIRTNPTTYYKGKDAPRGIRWTRDEVLDLLKNFQDLQKLDKLTPTYTTSLIDDISDDGRLHTQFKQHGTRSGRFSSANPNFQNMPRSSDPNNPAAKYDIRQAFQADPGWVFVLCDYSTMEMRIAAAMSGCPQLTEIITGKRLDSFGNPIDIHLYTACEAFSLVYDQAVSIFGDKAHERYKIIKEYRQKAKPVNFGILYGMTEWGLAADLNETVDVAKAIIAGFMRAYPGVAQWMQQVELYLRSHLYTETFYGRRRRISAAEARNEKAFRTAYRACLNHTIQGTGADVVKKSMTKVHNALLGYGFKGRISAQIHDEIIVHCPQEEYEDIARLMIREMFHMLGNIPLPAEAEVKRTWSKMEDPIWKLAA